MYAFIEGPVQLMSPSVVCLLAGGVGYELHISLQTYSKIREQREQCRLLTHLQVREDAWVLYGFADEAERATFRALLAISGVGAATARLILSSLTPEDLQRAVAGGQAATLEKVKGIGAKTAQRIILELKGKLQPVQAGAGGVLTSVLHNTKEEDALIALVNLGIAKSAAENAINKVKDPALSVEDLIKQALRAL